jgi:hypothetical protein
MLALRMSERHLAVDRHGMLNSTGLLNIVTYSVEHGLSSHVGQRPYNQYAVGLVNLSMPLNSCF